MATPNARKLRSTSQQPSPLSQTDPIQSTPPLIQVPSTQASTQYSAYDPLRYYTPSAQLTPQRDSLLDRPPPVESTSEILRLIQERHEQQMETMKRPLEAIREEFTKRQR
ncbi:hypothetical protein BJ508DRAFT_336868, partial [Ascobolus immersus RN42]